MRAAAATLAACAALALGGCGGSHEATAPVWPGITVSAVGSGSAGAFVMRPAGVLGPLPGVIFLHGWMATNPAIYTAWITHLVAEGNQVIYPVYQDSSTLPADSLAPMLAGVREALRRAPIRPGTLIAVGHSAGGLLAFDYASVAGLAGLPPPRAVMAAYPGRQIPGTQLLVPFRSPRRIAPSTRILAMAGAGDRTVGESVARSIVATTTQIPRSHRRLIIVTDVRVADHGAPQRFDAVARRTFWARLDRLIRQARGRPISGRAVPGAGLPGSVSG